MPDIDNLQIKIKAEATTAYKSIDKLAASLTRLNTSVSNGAGKLNSIASGLQSISGATKSLNSRNITTLATAMGKISSVNADGIRNVSDAVQTLSQGFSNVSGINVSGILSLADSMSKLGGVNATQGTANLLQMKDQLQQFVQGMNSVGNLSFDATGLTSLISALSKLGGKTATQATANLPTLSAQLQNFVRQMNQIGNLSFDASSLAELTTAIAKLGSTASGNAVTNIPQLATALNNLFTTLSQAPNVSSNVVSMTNALANLAGSLSNTGSYANSTGKSLNLFGTYADKTSKKSISLASAIGKVYASYWLLFRAFNKIRSSITLSSDLTEVQNVVDVTFGDMSDKVEDFAETSIEKFGMSELALKQFSSRFQAMGSAMGIDSGSLSNATSYLSEQTNGYVELSDSMSDMSLTLTKLTADMASFYNLEQEDVAEDLESIFTGQTRPLRTYGLDLTEATLKEWALKQGLDADMDSMTQAEKTMLRYQYVLANTTAAQGDFERTSDTWANQTRILKQNFEQLGSVIGGTLINAFKPFVQALNAVMDDVIVFAETVSNALGAIFGWKIEIGSGGATNDMDDFAEAADDAASGIGDATDNAKELKKALSVLPFDELNQLEAATTSGGSGSGSGSGGSGDIGSSGSAASAKLVRTDSIFDKYTSDIHNLYELGDYIGDALSKAMNSIDWDSVYGKARNFGKGLADFLNGLISPDLFSSLGQTIAGALNTALYFLNSFGHTFDWSDFGRSLAAGLNKFFSTFDFLTLADTINTWAHGILDTIITFIEKTDWQQIGEKIGEFLANVDFVGIMAKVGKAIWAAINAAFSAFESTFETAPLETALLSLVAVTKVLKTTNIGTFATAIGGAYTNTVNFVAALAGSKTGLKNLQKNSSKAASVVTALRNSFTGINGNVFKGVNNALGTLRDNLTTAQKGAITAVAAFAEFSVVSDSIHDIATGTGDLATNILELGTTTAASALAMYTALGPAGLAVAAVDFLVAAVSGINEAISEIRIEAVGQAIHDALANPGGVTLDELASSFSDTVHSIGDGFSYISEQSSEMDTADNNIRDTYTEISKIKVQMDEGVISVEEGTQKLSELFGNLQTIAQQKFSAIENTILAALGKDGAMRGALEQVGVNAEEITASVIGLSSETMNRITEITELLNSGTLTDAEYQALYEEEQQLLGYTDEISTAISDFEFDINSTDVDYSSLVPESGELDESALTNYLEVLTNAISDADSDIETAYKDVKTNLESMRDNASILGDEEAVALYENALSKLPKAMEQNTGAISAKAQETTDALQTEFLDQITAEIEAAGERWDNMSAWEKMYNGNNKTLYIQDSINDYKTQYIDPLSESIESSFSELGINGAGWASDAANQIIDSLFEENTLASGQIMTTLSENYKEIVSGATSGVKDLWESAGKEGSDGYISGFSKSDINDAVTKGINEAIETARTAQDSGSPSREYAKVGKEAAQGYANGMTSDSILTSAGTTMVNTILASVKDLASSFKAAGQTAAQTFVSGFQSVNIPTPHLNVSSYATSAFGNSRLSIPNFGINWYKSGGFIEDGLFTMNAGELAGRFNNGKSVVANNQQITEGIADAVYPAVFNAVMSAMSNSSSGRNPEYIMNSIEIDGEVVARAVTKGQQSIDRRYNPTIQFGY